MAVRPTVGEKGDTDTDSGPGTECHSSQGMTRVADDVDRRTTPARQRFCTDSRFAPCPSTKTVTRVARSADTAQIGEVVTTIPTIGFNVESVTYKNLNFNVWVCK